MKWTNYRHAVICAGLLWCGLGKAKAQDAVFVSVSDTSSILVEPGSVGTRLVRISNPTEAPLESRLVLNMPSGWSLLIPPPAFSLAPGKAINQLFSFQVPVSTIAGQYSVGIAIEDHRESEAILPVDVLPAYAFRTEWIENQEFARAGRPISGKLSVVNTGNAPLDLAIRGRSSLGYQVDLSTSELQLSVGETRLVDATVYSRDDIVNRQSHSLVLELDRTKSSDDKPLIASFITDIIPVKKAFSANREGMLPARLSFSGTTEDGRRAGQIELALPETAIGLRRYEALIRVPDVRDASVFASSDQYYLKITTPQSTIRLGDQVYGSTDLLETGSLGFGAGVEVNRTRISAGGFAQRSRKIYPERQQAGAFVHVRPLPELQLEANVLAKRSYEAGESMSFAVEASPLGNLLRAEYALGWFDSNSGRQSGRAYSVSGSTGYKKSSLSANYESADAHFLGAIQNTKSGSGAFTLQLRSWLRVHGQARARKRFYDLLGGERADQTTATAQTGVTFTRSAASRSFAAITVIKQLSDNTLSALQRDDTALQLRLGTNWRRAGFGSTLVRGQAEDGLRPDLKAYFSGSGTAYATRGPISVNVFGSYLEGPTFYNPVKQERIMFGGSVGWDSNKGTRLSVSVFKSVDLVQEQQEFMLSDTRLVHRFSFGHELTLRARLAQTASDASIRDGTFGATYRIPLFIPAPGQNRNKEKLEGSAMDAETGKPLQGVIITLDSESKKTGVDGRFSFSAPTGASEYLSVDRSSIGLDRRPVAEMPMRIQPDIPDREQLLIQIVRSARISLKVSFDSLAAKDRTTALAQTPGSNALAGIVVEAQNGDLRIRRLSGRSGEVIFSDLVPGMWKVFPVGSTLPEGYQTVPDSVRLDLGPGQQSDVKLVVQPVSRGIRMVSSGGVAISKGVQVVNKAPVKIQEEDRAVSTAPEAAVRHVVVEGETLTGIAQHYFGSSLYWIRIWWANEDRLIHPGKMAVGQTLIIPSASPLSLSEWIGLIELGSPEFP